MTRKTWTGFVLFLLIAAGLAALGTATSRAVGRPDGVTAAVKLRCVASGVRFAGTTANGFKLCLTRSRDGKRLLEYAYNGVKCPGIRIEAPIDWRASKASAPVTIGRDGSFSHRARLFHTSTALFEGRFVSATTAKGVLRATVTLLLGGTCDTGKVSWTARRVGA